MAALSDVCDVTKFTGSPVHVEGFDGDLGLQGYSDTLIATSTQPNGQAKQGGTSPPLGPPQAGKQQSRPKFDHATALEFYDAVRPRALILGFTEGRSITSAEEFQTLAKEAGDKHEHLFFHVATLKTEWGDPKTHEKGKITTASKDKAVNMPDGSASHVLECPYLWGDCDAKKYIGNDPVEAAKHYANEGSRVRTAIDKGLLALGIAPFAIWRSGAGWQFLIILDQTIGPDEAETLVGKLHAALGFDPVVRNANRILRVPGSVNWKDGKDSRVPSPCTPLRLLGAVAKIDDVRKALADIKLPVKEAKPKDKEAPKGEKFKPSDTYEPIEPDDPALSRLDDKWRGMIAADNYAMDYKGDHSSAEFAVVCEAIRANIDDATIARVLMDERRKFGSHTREKADYRLPRIINRGHDLAIDPDLADMNDKFFVAPIGHATCVVSLEDDPKFPGRMIIGRAQSFKAFTDLHSNKRKKWKTTDKDGVVKVTNIPLGGWWLRQERRRQYDGGMAFMPQHDTEVVGNTLNKWRGFAVQSRKPEGKSGAAGSQLMLDHIKNVLCSGNEEHYDYFIKRLAKIFQERCRTEIGMILRSKAEGTGKGFFEKHVHSKLLGEAYMQVTNPDHVIGKHNEHLETNLVLCADEALFAGDPRHRNALYSLITEPMIAVEPKFIGTYSAPNFVNVDLLSNMDHVVFVGPTARRLFIPTVAEDRVGDLEYFGKIEAQLQDYGYEALLYHLQHEIDLRDFDVRKVPKTEGLAEQARYSRKGVDALVESVCNDARVPCEIGGAAGCSRTGDQTEQGTLDYLLANSKDRELQKPLTVKRRLCSDWGCKSGDAARIWNGSRHVACLQWPALADLRELFVKHHGPQIWNSADVTEWIKGDA